MGYLAKKNQQKFNFEKALERNILKSRKLSAKSNSGFTLIEMLVVVIIIGVLSAIAAPGWLVFTNRQRVNKVNDAVFSALQKAQTEAKRTKLNYSVKFQNSSDNFPQVAVYPGDASTPATQYTFNSLGENLDIKPNQVKVSTTTTAPITFDYQGNVKSTLPSEGVTVTVSLLPNLSPKRCVVVQTILGGMRTDGGEYDSATKKGCKQP